MKLVIAECICNKTIMKSKNINLISCETNNNSSLQYSSNKIVPGGGPFVNLVQGFGWGVETRHKLFQWAFIYKSFKSLRTIGKLMH